ncbi:MAG: hypothetical protein IT314_16075 [Anaerolineales bacterium]|nr:hypothetical protein [Anaerolineales bacterium]
MKVEVDQSGKIGDTKVPTVLAFSNGKRYAILIPAKVKRESILHFRKKRKMETRLYIQLFAVGLYLLLKRDIKRLEQIVIDFEYPGHEPKIKEHLINLFQRAGIKVSPAKIQFDFVRKKSNAHKLAIETFNGKVKPNLVIHLEDVLGEFR